METKKLSLEEMGKLQGGSWSSSCTWELIGAAAVSLALLSNPVGWLALSSVLISGATTEAALIKCISDY